MRHDAISWAGAKAPKIRAARVSKRLAPIPQQSAQGRHLPHGEITPSNGFKNRRGRSKIEIACRRGDAARPSGMHRTLFHTLAAYAVAFAIILYLARGIAPAQLLHDLAMARLWVFIPACAGSFAIWFLGETLLFSLLFSYFNSRISFREMLPANAAQY